MEQLQNLTQRKTALRDACTAELHSIAQWWAEHSVDPTGGFYAEIQNNGNIVPQAEKGIILNTRILWFFSELCLLNNTEKYRHLADRAYQYLMVKFDDKCFGGVIWSVSEKGLLKSGKKQTYAQAFAIYALSAYFRLTKNEAALEKALTYFDLIENNALDHSNGGYVEAFRQDWQPINDLRLSEKDTNAPKTMNTHLHILEAYTALYRTCGATKVKRALRRNIEMFCDHIVNFDTHHLGVFFDMQWNDLSQTYSYGHDIEASWLLYDALATLDDKDLLNSYSRLIVEIAGTCLAQGIGPHNEVLDRFDINTQTRHSDSEWWIQAEALVGFINAWQLSNNPRFFVAAENIWQFIRRYHLDREHGEWFWYSTLDQQAGFNRYKLGFWKAPYHNGRAMLEIIARLKNNN